MAGCGTAPRDLKQKGWRDKNLVAAELCSERSLLAEEAGGWQPAVANCPEAAKPDDEQCPRGGTAPCQPPTGISSRLGDTSQVFRALISLALYLKPISGILKAAVRHVLSASAFHETCGAVFSGLWQHNLEL